VTSSYFSTYSVRTKLAGGGTVVQDRSRATTDQSQLVIGDFDMSANVVKSLAIGHRRTFDDESELLDEEGQLERLVLDDSRAAWSSRW
jgi:hypothetical protein